MLSLLILLIWKLKQHLSGTAGAPEDTARTQLSSNTLSPSHPSHPRSSPLGGPPRRPCTKQTRVLRALTLCRDPAAQHSEQEEESAELRGCLRHAGLREAAVSWGQGQGAAFMEQQRSRLPPGPAVTCAGGGPGPLPCPKAQRVSNAHPLPAQPREGGNLLPDHTLGPQVGFSLSSVQAGGQAAPKVWLHIPVPLPG